MSRSQQDAPLRAPPFADPEPEQDRGAPPAHEMTNASSEPSASPLRALLQVQRSALPTPQPFVAWCTDVTHPSLPGRVKIRREPAAGAHEAEPEHWVPALHGLDIRVGARVLVQSAEGCPEPIVIGVIDGPAHAEVPPERGAAVVLGREQAVRVESPDGQALLEIVQDEHGPIVRLLGGASRIELPGKLSISAAELELKASSGSARIEASDEVQVCGKVIHLN